MIYLYKIVMYPKLDASSCQLPLHYKAVWAPSGGPPGGLHGHPGLVWCAM